MKNGRVMKYWPFFVAAVAAAVAWGALQAQVAQHDQDIDKLAEVVVDQAVAANDIEAIKLQLESLRMDFDDANQDNQDNQVRILQVVQDIERQTRQQ